MSKLTKAVVASLAPGKIHYFAGVMVEGGGKAETPRGFGVRVTPAGCRSFVIRYSINGQDRLAVIGQHPDWSLIDAVAKAREMRMRVDCGEDPLVERREQEAASKETVKAICEEYFKNGAAKLRSVEERKRTLERLVYPEFGKREIASIKRSEINRLLDRIATENGPVMADRTLAYMRKVFNWHAARSDDFHSPVVPGMARTSGKERARQRILTDDELRAVWKAAEACTGVFGRLVRFILLTAARREEAASMTWAELPDGVWLLPAARNKTKVDLARPLSREARAVLPARHGEFVFTTYGTAPFSGFSKALEALQAASGTADWTTHDLRRTARTLMTRAGVSDEHAEQCLGHVLPGVKGVYNVWKYLPEKLRAYDALAGIIERIVNPVENVLPLKTAASSQAPQAIS